MIRPRSRKLLLAPADFTPTDERLEVIGVFNPGAVRFGDEIILLVRVAQAPREKREGWLLSPRGWFRGGQPSYAIDRFRVDREAARDHRKPLVGLRERRLAFVSHLELVRLSSDGYSVKELVRKEELVGQSSDEEYGIEDPRITRLDDQFCISYVAVSRARGVCTCLMTTSDFQHFSRRSVMFPAENKDVVLYPERFDGLAVALHRPVPNAAFGPLAIWIASSPDLKHWGGHRPILHCADAPGWYSSRIGAGTPPVRTRAGWLSIFHGVQRASGEDGVGLYSAGAMVTALDAPGHVLAVSEEPFLLPEEDHERLGYVDNVVFPTGIVRDAGDEDKLHVYYGCADTCVAVRTYSTSDILASLGL